MKNYELFWNHQRVLRIVATFSDENKNIWLPKQLNETIAIIGLL